MFAFALYFISAVFQQHPCKAQLHTVWLRGLVTCDMTCSMSLISCHAHKTVSSLATLTPVRIQAMLQTALGSEGWTGHSAPVSRPITCQALADQAAVRQLVNMLAAVLGQPGLPSSFATALAHVGASRAFSSSWPDFLEVRLYKAWVGFGFRPPMVGGTFIIYCGAWQLENVVLSSPANMSRMHCVVRACM